MYQRVVGVRVWAAVAALLVGVLAGMGRAGEVDLPRHPSISPDGRQVVFSWRGDLWRVPIGGGEAFRLTAHPATESASAWSPDGQWIAFESTRSGRRSIHLMRPDGTDVRQVTFEDGALSLSGFSADGSRILVSGAIEGDVYRSARPYWVPVEGGPLTRLHDAFGQAATMSPDGSSYAFERGGTSLTRRHYRGPDDRDVYLYDESDGSFTRLTEWNGHDAEPKWRNRNTIIYMSDRGDQETIGLWSMDPRTGEDGAIRLTGNTDRDILGFDVSRDGRALVYAKWDGLYAARFGGRRLESESRMRITAPADAFPRRESRDVSRDVDEALLSPDGKVMAYVAFGDVYIQAIEDGSTTVPVTQDMARARDIAWSPDMSRLYFVSDKDGTDSIYAATVSLTRKDIRDRFAEAMRQPEPEAPSGENADEPENGEPEPEDKKKDGKKPTKAQVTGRWQDAIRFEIHPIVVEATDDFSPSPSPDGTRLAFKRTRGDLIVRDLLTGEDTVLLEHWDFRMDFRWSPVGDFIAYSVNDADYNTDIIIAPVDGSWPGVNLTKHPNNDHSPRWSADGKILAFLSEREGDHDVHVVMLDRSMEAMTNREIEAYLKSRSDATRRRGAIDPIDWSAERKEDKKAGDAPFTREDLEDAYRRLRRVTSYPGNTTSLKITPAGDRLIFRAVGGAGGTTGVYSVKWDGSDERRLATAGSPQQVSMDGSRVVIIASGRASTVSPTGASTNRHDISHRIELDHRAHSLQKFHEMARTLGRTFYHPTMKDLDWEKLTEEYAELAARAYTANEFADVAIRLLGELSASHLGVTPPSDYSNPDFRASGRLGIDATPLGDGRFRVDRVLPRSRTIVGEMGLREGDVITAIELEPLRPGDTLDMRLAGRTGDETIVTVDRSIPQENGGSITRSVDLIVVPISNGAERALRYDDWQLSNARMVHELSDGRLGYLHIRAMGAPDLVEFERDLFAAAYGRDGLIIDVRSNGGGWTTDRVLASLMYPKHAYTIPRGATEENGRGYPQDRLFIQRYNLPVNMLCNTKSFSNAEIISHAFKTVGRGTLVGEQTHGSVISTGAFTLVDGTRVRQPFRGWFTPDGTDMENNGAMPDILVPQTPQDEVDGVDRQLKAAVEDLLKRLD
ncbi:MAG: hypothetical protein LAT64_03095 [Phycisphaerales bacterium]|nr:PD40 domain-containing protein [Planctomycetota bacterium]MCH8507743.1 hypothetical protein [Phycisphaerales bacterium]